MARPKRSLGQNFLVDPNIQRKIVAALGAGPDDEVLEIGPGTGALTRHLAGSVRRLVAVELDDALAAALRDEFGDTPGVEIVHANALDLDLDDRIEDVASLKVVGNIPYNITTPLLFWLLERPVRPARIVVMVQKEVAARILADPGEKSYGALSVGVRAVADVERLFHVSRHAFRPVPDVDSTVIRITPHRPAPLSPDEERDLRTLTRTAFSRRRKQLQKILRTAPGYGLDAARVAEVGAAADIDMSARPETLEPGAFVRLARALRAAGFPTRHGPAAPDPLLRRSEMHEPPTRPRGRLLRALGLDRRELRSWALYDWANSAFATTIIAAVLPIYYSSVAAGDLPAHIATAYWGYTASAALLIIALASPVIGAMADYLGAKKRFLAGFLGFGAVATACLFLVRRGDWPLASALFIIGNVCYSASIVFADSLLPHIASDDEVDRVSTAGYAVGYIGGGILLAINLLMIQRPTLFGFADAAAATPWVFVTVAVWWTLFSVPLFRNVPEPPRRLEAGERPGAGAVRASFARLRETFGEVRQYRDLFKFLIAFWFYNDGIGTIIEMATIYGTEIGIGQGSLIGALLLVQFLGIPFTFAFGGLAHRIGARNGLYLALGVYTVIAIFGYFLASAWHFWLLAAAVGMVQGGAQALSRSLYATMVPRAKSSEFFGFYSVFAKVAGIAGPLVFALVGQLTGTGRLGILALVLFFVGGIVLLSRVDIDEGRRVARREDATLHPVGEPSPTA